MKIRTGFVSNSSSSSFVIQRHWLGGEFKDASDVARYMIPQRGWDDDQELIEKINKLQNGRNVEPINAICFNSCNYDTFIVKMDDKFLISTCNNHDWQFPAGTVTTCPPEYEQYWGDEYFYDLSQNFDFLNLNHDFVGRRPTWDMKSPDVSHCPGCYADNWIVERKIVCPNCQCPNKRKQ
jgi:hypothetical protein